MSTVSLNVDWLDDLIASFQSTAKAREPDLFEILTYGSSEQVNSNLLAFYLDRDAHHGFKDLFLSALKATMQRAAKDIEDYNLHVIGSTAYEVKPEASAYGKRIDLLITGKPEDGGAVGNGSSNALAPWCLIIENKLYAGLNNRLDVYWDSVSAVDGAKFGVVLSLRPVPDELLKSDGFRYVNVLHKDLAAEVRSQLSTYYEEASDRHLLILKEYLRSIANHYENYVMDPSNENDLILLREKEPQINALNRRIEALQSYVIHRFFHVLRDFGYKPYTQGTGSITKHFYADQEFCREIGARFGPYFRFFVRFSDAIYHDQLHMYFELYDEYSTYGDALKKLIEEHYGEEGLQKLNLTLGSSQSAKGGYYHIAYMEEFPLNSKGDFERGLRNCLAKSFFDPSDNFVDRCTAWMKELTSA